MHLKIKCKSSLSLLTLLSLTSSWSMTSSASSAATPKGSEASNRQRLSRSHLEFALQLFRQLTSEADPSENVILSPYSVSSVLSQLWYGAGNGSETQSSLASLLHYSDGGLPPKQILEAFKSTLTALDEPEYKNMVQAANAVFVQAGLQILPEYIQGVREYYNGSLDEVDFESEETAARSIINRWVSVQTKGQIPSLLQSPLPGHTKLLLVNALSLRALWNNSFDPSVTSARGIFYPDAKSKLEIPMMQGRFDVLLGSNPDLGCRLLELPFQGRRLSMFILLPGSVQDESYNSAEEEPILNPEDLLQNLFTLESNLTAENLKRLFSTLKEETVEIRLPRFRVEQNLPLTGTLTQMGLNIFDASSSDFSSISNVSSLHVSAMAHRVVFEVREEGASASAASGTFIQRLWKVGEKFFEVNRPFIFFVWDYHNGALLFIGRVVNPTPLFS